MRKRNLLRFQHYRVRKRRFEKRRCGFFYPCRQILMQVDSTLASEHKGLPCTDRRKPALFSIVQFSPQMAADFLRLPDHPEPDVGVQQNPQSRNTSQSSGSVAGETMSPTMSIFPFINPNKSLGTFGAVGTRSATGFPNLVIRTGCLVF